MYFTNHHISKNVYLWNYSPKFQINGNNTKTKTRRPQYFPSARITRLKQEALAVAIGVSQQKISNIENSEDVEDDKLKLIAKELGITVEAIKNFSEENVINYFNNFYDNSAVNGIFNPNHCTFNPIDKLVEVYEENKELYKQLLQAEKDKTAYLEKLYNAK